MTSPMLIRIAPPTSVSRRRTSILRAQPSARSSARVRRSVSVSQRGSRPAPQQRRGVGPPMTVDSNPRNPPGVNVHDPDRRPAVHLSRHVSPVGRGPGWPAGLSSVKTPAIGGAVTRNHVPRRKGSQVEGLVYATSVLGGGKLSHPECLGDAIKPRFHGVGRAVAELVFGAGPHGGPLARPVVIWARVVAGVSRLRPRGPGW